MPEIGLVTVLYHSDEVLEEFFKSLSAQNFADYHLYLIDNSGERSSLGRIELLVKRYPVSAYTYIYNEQNVGFAEASNQGIRKSKEHGTSYTLLLNNDIRFADPGLLAGMLAAAREKDEYIITPKIMYYNSTRVWMAGGRISMLKGVTHHVGAGEEDHPSFGISGHVEFAPACFLMIDNRVFKRTGLLDKNYFVYYEDTDFLLRARKLGFKVYYLASKCVEHRVNFTTGGENSLFSIYYMYRNRIYFLRKNAPLPKRYVAFIHVVYKMARMLMQYPPTERKTMLRGFFAGFSIKIPTDRGTFD